MNVTAVLAEIVIIGSTFNIGVFLIIAGIDKNIIQTISVFKDIDAILLVFLLDFHISPGEELKEWDNSSFLLFP